MFDFTVIGNTLAIVYEANWLSLVLLLMIGVVIYNFRYELTDNYRDQKKLLNFVSGIIFLPIIATVGYISIKGYFIWFFITIVMAIIMFLLYKFRLLDRFMNAS